MKIQILIILSLLIPRKNFAQINSSSFGTRVDFTSATPMSNEGRLAFADFNSDGKIDVITTNFGNATVSIFRNVALPGTINSSSFATKVDIATSTSPNGITCADFDGDGKTDFAVGYYSGSLISVFKNTTTGNTITFSSAYNYTVGSLPSHLVAKDFDNDGKPDIATANYGSNTISVLRNVSTIGTPSFSAMATLSTGSSPTFVGCADFNGDGKIDISCSNYVASGTVSVFQNSTTSTTITFGTAITLTAGSLPSVLDCGDLDGDGKQDISVVNYNGNTFYSYRNTSSLATISFSASTSFASSGPGTTYPQGISTSVDLDNDGKNDVITTNSGTSGVISVYKNIGSSGSISASTLAAPVSFSGVSGANMVFVTSTDIDGDSKPDILIANQNTGNFSILHNEVVFPPTSAATSITFGNIQNNNMNITLAKGNGASRIVICKQGSGVNASPVNNTAYTANTAFGGGTQLGTGNYVVYSDTGNTFTLTGLSQNTTYYFSVFEYNGTGTGSLFLTSSYLTGSQITSNNTYYFSKSTGNLNTLSTWGTATDGSGTAPVSFSTPNSYYYIFNNPAPTMSANLTITGGNTALVVGDGVNTYNFSIPSGFTLTTDTLVVKKFATLTVNGTLAGSTNIFEDTSTAQFTGASAQDLPTASYYNLVTSSALKTMTGNVVVRNNFVMMSSVNMNSYAMMLGTSALLRGTLNRTSGTLYGGTLMRWFTNATNTGSTGLFPIGTSTDYRPVQIDYTTAPTSGGSLSASFVTTSPSQTGLPFFDFNTASSTININAIGSNGTWQLAPSTLSGGQFTGFFTASAFTGVSSYADLRLVRRASSGSAWSTTGISQAATGSNAIPVVSRTGMTLFGEFGIGGDVAVNALPVKIIILSVQQDNNSNALLKWETASELNSDHFEILRSVDDINWTSLGKVASAGNSNEIRKYAFADDIKSFINRETKTIYYQLKQVDKDGSVAYSNIITVNLKTATNAVTLYPLPISNILHAVSNNGETVIGVSLFDMSGKELITTTNGKMDVSTLAEGVYIAKVTTDRDVYYQKITK